MLETSPATRTGRALRSMVACAAMLAAIPSAAPCKQKAGGHKDRKRRAGGNKAAKKVGKKKAGGKHEEMAPPPPAVTFATMKKLLDPSPQQVEKLRSRWEARAQAIGEWQASEPGQRLKRLEEQQLLGRADHSVQIRELAGAREAWIHPHDAKIFKALTPAQRKTWLGLLLYRSVSLKYREAGVPLTVSQARRARDVCRGVAADHSGAYPSEAALSALEDRAARAVFEQVLTDQQRERIAPGYERERKRSTQRTQKRHRKKRKKRRTRRTKIKKPKVKKPKIKKPSVKRPKVKKPKVRKPRVRKPKTGKPKVREPSI